MIPEQSTENNVAGSAGGEDIIEHAMVDTGEGEEQLVIGLNCIIGSDWRRRRRRRRRKRSRDKTDRDQRTNLTRGGPARPIEAING